MELDNESKKFIKYCFITYPIRFATAIIFMILGFIFTFKGINHYTSEFSCGIFLLLFGMINYNNLYHNFKEYSLALILNELIIGLLKN